MKVLGRNELIDAMHNARECLEAMAGVEDVETRVALWRASLRYRALVLEKMREASRGEYRAAPLAADGEFSGFRYGVE